MNDTLGKRMADEMCLCHVKKEERSGKEERSKDISKNNKPGEEE